MKTLFLMPNTWDLALDVHGNLATATSTYQRAQDIASACRVFKQDMYFNQTEGIPYLEDILGKGKYSLALYRKHLTDAALSIEGVTEVKVDLYPLNNRLLRGAIQFKDKDGKTGVIDL
ncbi:hypothetical protein [Acinetobacter larvae]|uniref:Uncharacterized protein n=1 Tax=Acinetobacter larvae TaxID=1789224 RepID=A0A1B2LZG0_9GAMM|nr:hypothetical protein [Acinetobacter larvae]AOA58338.1 hypothetical protein BFG52_08205 [Acinetobacter larvae]